jgi:hypothetical protein
MKRFLEPVTGVLLSIVTWEAWTDLFVSLFIAFMGGILAYLGKWLATRAVRHMTRRKNVFISRIREAVNSHNSPEED